jgi:hypothetical protein
MTEPSKTVTEELASGDRIAWPLPWTIPVNRPTRWHRAPESCPVSSSRSRTSNDPSQARRSQRRWLRPGRSVRLLAER